jgi:hypothetical protein
VAITNGQRMAESVTSEGVQVYLSFLSNFPTDRIIFPTEMLLRRVFTMHDVKVLDVTVKEYKCFQVKSRFFFASS